ncbi:MAG: hypothetical protein ACFB3T_01255 [Geminicoccaceae bacterium]
MSRHDIAVPAASATLPWPNRIGLALATLLLALVAVAFLVPPLTAATHQIPLLYNEGWNAFHAARAIGDATLYDPETPWIVLNYPPVSYYVTGLLGVLMDDQVYAGRAVAIVSLFATALFIILIARRLSGGWLPGLLAGVVFLAVIPALFRDYVGTYDPQFFAHALMTGGLAVFVWRRNDGWQLFAATLLMVLAGLVKHIVLPIPIVVALWLLMHNRRAFLWYAVYGTAIAALALGLIYIWWGEAFVESMQSARQYTVTHLITRVLHWLPRVGIILVLWLLLLVSTKRDRASDFVHLYVIVALAITTLLAGGIGVHYNAMFDLVIALSLASALIVSRMSLVPETSRAFVRGVGAAALALIIASPVFIPFVEVAFEWYAMRGGTFIEREEVARQDIAAVEAVDGAVICENLSICYWAGKDFILDPYGANQFFLLGSLDEQPLFDKLASGEIRAVHLEHTSGFLFEERFPPGFKDVLERHFSEIETEGPGSLFVFAADSGDGGEDEAPDTGAEPDAAAVSG